MTNLLIIIGIVLSIIGFSISIYWAVQMPKIIKMHQDAMRLYQQELDRQKKQNKDKS